MATMDLSLPVPRERFSLIADIRNLRAYELAGWTPEFDAVFKGLLDAAKMKARLAAGAPFREALKVCKAQRSDIFVALGGVMDFRDPKYDQAATDMLTREVGEFEARLQRIGDAAFDGVEAAGADELKLAILRGKHNVMRSSAPGIAVRLTPAGKAALFRDHYRPKLLPGTSTFFHLPGGEYTVGENEITLIEGSTGRHLKLEKKDVLTIKPVCQTDINAINSRHYSYYSDGLWHNPTYLPNGEPHKFHTQEFLKAVSDQGLRNLLFQEMHRDDERCY